MCQAQFSYLRNVFCNHFNNSYVLKIIIILWILILRLGEGNGNPLQYSCLENPMDGGAWWDTVHGVSRSPTRLSNFTLAFHFHALEKEMTTHSSVLVWRIPGLGSLVGCRLWGLTELDRTDVTAAAAYWGSEELHSCLYLYLFLGSSNSNKLYTSLWCLYISNFLFSNLQRES